MTDTPVYTIGIDLGGTKIEAVLHDGKRIRKTARVATEDAKGYATVLANIATVVTQVRRPEVIAIGIGIPGYVYQGLQYGCPNNTAIVGKPFLADLQKQFDIPVFAENDAKLFGLAEARLGAGKGKANVIGLIVGTGIGAGIIIDGKILRGAFGAAGEVGDIPYLDKTYEYYTAGPAIDRMYKDGGGKHAWGPKEILTRFFPDPVAKKVRVEHREHLARLVATVVNTFNPDVIMFGGGVSNSLDYKALRAETAKYAMPIPIQHVALVKHKISDSAGAIGAAMLARESVAKA